MFPLDRPHGAPLLENRGRVWVRDKGLSVWSAVKAFSLGIIPANSQTNVCGTADLTRPPETSSTSRLELENKQLPNPNSALKIKTPGSAPFYPDLHLNLLASPLALLRNKNGNSLITVVTREIVFTLGRNHWWVKWK